MKWLILLLFVIIAVSGCIETVTTISTVTSMTTTTSTSTSTTTSNILSACTGFKYFIFQDQEYRADGTYTIELLNGNQSVSILSMMVVNNINAGPILGNRQPSASEKFNITAKGYYYPGYKGKTFSFRVAISYMTPNIITNSDIATCTGIIQ
jgi:hypothetical protein